ncbi:hypothetical protein KIN20_008128 [Parelaphostrongylus tenuis]|uniref:Uncharacterized protein n=1 Tax=Parelaphostrongylus tenuis TaxID=148309 RepID=A0AAD5MQN9_PARTN|nr:hypothetical protein KIN20_008128 [Parelaphostrongylus tenuis]
MIEHLRTLHDIIVNDLEQVCGNVIKHLRNGPDQNFCSSDGRFSHNDFVIESFSSSSEDSHPDWKAPLPPSMYLRKKSTRINSDVLKIDRLPSERLRF